MTQIRILLIDDNPSDRALVIRELQREFDQPAIQEIISSGEFNSALARGDFDIVITDFQLRWMTGLEILERVKHHYPECPVIMFTNTGTEEIAVEAMKLGLDDYITKEPNRYIRVPASVRSALERHQMMQRAALLEIRLQELLGQVNIGIFRSTSDGTLLETNPAFLELLGAESINQARAMRLLDLHGCYNQLVNLPPPKRQEQTVQLQRRDGSQFWALLTTTLNTVEGITVVDGLLEDITPLKQAEVMLQESNDTLEARVQERTAQLAAANQELEEFVYSITHDLRAPLRNIEGFAQVLLNDLGDSLEPEHLKFLQRILANIQHLDGLIADLLNYSRLSHSAIELEPVNLSVVLTEALNQLESEIKRQQAQIHIDSPLPTVCANRLILIQAVINILSNAIKFVAPGEHPQVRVWAEQQAHQTRVWIEDNGIGIAPENHSQIFRPFTRLHGEEEYPGTGIGLAVARKGIERMGGDIGVESTLGNGSRFWIALPMLEERS